MFIHSGKRKLRFLSQKVLRSADEMADFMADEMTYNPTARYGCPICKHSPFFGAKSITDHLQEVHPKNAKAIFSINPMAWMEWEI